MEARRMRRSTTALVALLAVSAVLNVSLLVRGRAEPSPTAESRPARPTTSAPAEAMTVEGRTIATLQARIRELEADKKVLADVPLPAATDGRAALRTKLRRIMEIFAHPEGNSFSEPAVMLEYSEVSLEIGRAAMARSKDPRAYVDMLRSIYETALDDPGHPLGESQKATLGKVFDDLGASLAAIRADSAGEKRLQEIDTEAAAMDRLRQALDPARVEALGRNQLLSMAGQWSLNTVHLMDKNREEQILTTWGQAYGLEAAQKDVARPAARALAAELERLADVPDPAKEHRHLQGGTAENYRLRRSLLQAQLAALRQFEGSLGAEQRERLRSQVPRDFFIMKSSLSADEDEDVEEKK
jgi:hypothetical protein